MRLDQSLEACWFAHSSWALVMNPTNLTAVRLWHKCRRMILSKYLRKTPLPCSQTLLPSITICPPPPLNATLSALSTPSHWIQSSTSPEPDFPQLMNHHRNLLTKLAYKTCFHHNVPPSIGYKESHWSLFPETRTLLPPQCSSHWMQFRLWPYQTWSSSPDPLTEPDFPQLIHHHTDLAYTYTVWCLPGPLSLLLWVAWQRLHQGGSPVCMYVCMHVYMYVL